MSILRELYDGLRAMFEPESRRIVEVDDWDGAASNYSTTESYCRATLLDLNSAAGRDEKAQSHCMLPVRREEDSTDTFVDRAVFAAAGGRGLTRVTRPSDVPEDAWNSARVRAANALIRAYGQMDRVAPDAIYEIAGREPPERGLPPLKEFWPMESKERALSMQRLGQSVWTQLLERDREHGEDNWLIDLYADGDGLYALVADRGKLYRYPLSMTDNTVTIGEPTEVMEAHPQIQSRTTVSRQEDGRWRWFSVSCSAVLNRMGEIDSRELFDSFARRCEETGEYPVRDFYHRRDPFRVGVTDFVARDGYMLVTSGVYDDSELARAEVEARKRDPEHWGDSIEFDPVGPAEMVAVGDVEIPVYNDGVLRYVSTLPVADAAAWFTRGELREVRRTMNDREFAAFVDLFDGDEDAARAWQEANVDPANRAVEERGLVARGGADGETGENGDTGFTGPNDGIPSGSSSGTVGSDHEPPLDEEIVLDEEAVEALAEAMGVQDQIAGALAPVQETLNALQGTLAGFNATLETFSEAARSLDERVEVLEADDEVKRQEWLADLPPRKRINATFRPRVDRVPENGAGDEEGEPTTAAEKRKADKKARGVPDY